MMNRSVRVRRRSQQLKIVHYASDDDGENVRDVEPHEEQKTF